MRGSVVSISFTFPRALEDKEEQTLRDIIKKNQTQNIEKHTRTRYAANNISERFMTYYSTMKVAKQLSLARSNRGIDCLAWLKSMGGRWACEEALTNFCAGL